MTNLMKAGRLGDTDDPGLDFFPGYFPRESASFADEVVMVGFVTVAIARFTVQVVDDVDNLFADHATKLSVDGGQPQSVTITNGLGVEFAGAGKAVDAPKGPQDDGPGLMRHGR